MITDRSEDVRREVQSLVGMCLLAYPRRDIPSGPFAVLTWPSSVPARTTSASEEVGTMNTYVVRIHGERGAGQRAIRAVAHAVADRLASELGCTRLGLTVEETDRGPMAVLTVQQVTDFTNRIMR